MSTPELEMELAHELRAIVHKVAKHTTSDDALREAILQARAMHGLLGEAPRPRWFDTLDDDGRSDERNLDFNAYGLYRGRANPIAPPVDASVIELPDGRPAVQALVTCSRLYEGPPNGVHGGYVAGLFDDILGGTMRFVGGPTGVTGTLEVKYRKVTPLDTELRFVAWVEHASGRRIHSRATCHAGELLTAEADALFVRVDMRRLAEGHADYKPRAYDPGP